MTADAVTEAPFGRKELGAARERDAAAVRRMVEQLLRVDEREPRLLEIAAGLDEISEQLEASLTKEPGIRLRGPRSFRSDPVTGVENALAPPVLLDVADGVVAGTVTFTLPYQGPDGLAHGGIMGLVLDQALSVAVGLLRAPVVTAQLSIRYCRPVPLFTPVTVTARRTEQDGRKIRAVGELLVDGEAAVVAEGLFIEKRLTPHT